MTLAFLVFFPMIAAVCSYGIGRKSKDARDVQMIEDAAREAADGSTAMYNCLIANVCDSVLPEHMQVPSGRRQFDEMRRRFFWLLDAKR